MYVLWYSSGWTAVFVSYRTFVPVIVVSDFHVNSTQSTHLTRLYHRQILLIKLSQNQNESVSIRTLSLAIRRNLFFKDCLGRKKEPLVLMVARVGASFVRMKMWRSTWGFSRWKCPTSRSLYPFMCRGFSAIIDLSSCACLILSESHQCSSRQPTCELLGASLFPFPSMEKKTEQKSTKRRWL